jgi:membrane-anchored protein YejM (alkaline phosphatase superfamily)
MLWEIQQSLKKLLLHTQGRDSLKKVVVVVISESYNHFKSENISYRGLQKYAEVIQG